VSIEYVTRGMTFDNLYVEVTVIRYICNECARRECFHDVPTPYGEAVPTPQGRGWELIYPIDDGEQEARCPQCVASHKPHPPAPPEGSGG